MQTRDIKIGPKVYSVTSDDSYLRGMGPEFEPNTIALFDRFVTKKTQVLDVGANIGLTSLFFGSKAEKVLSVEAVPTTYKILQTNIARAGFSNVVPVNRAASDKRGTLKMTYGNDNRSGGFVSSTMTLKEGHATEETISDRLDEIYKLGLDRVDFIKFDIEGYEKFALLGATNILASFKPFVVMELNHWCLNAFQRIALPDYFDFLRSIFPVCRALDNDNVTTLDLHDPDAAYTVMYHHILHGNFQTIIGGFRAPPF